MSNAEATELLEWLNKSPYQYSAYSGRYRHVGTGEMITMIQLLEIFNREK